MAAKDQKHQALKSPGCKPDSMQNETRANLNAINVCEANARWEDQERAETLEKGKRRANSPISKDLQTRRGHT